MRKRKTSHISLVRESVVSLHAFEKQEMKKGLKLFILGCVGVCVCCHAQKWDAGGMEIVD